VLEKLGAGTSVQIKRSDQQQRGKPQQLLPSQSYGREMNSHEREEQNTENSENTADEQDFQDNNSTGPTPRATKTEAKVSS